MAGWRSDEQLVNGVAPKYDSDKMIARKATGVAGRLMREVDKG